MYRPILIEPSAQVNFLDSFFPHKSNDIDATIGRAFIVIINDSNIDSIILSTHSLMIDFLKRSSFAHHDTSSTLNDLPPTHTNGYIIIYDDKITVITLNLRGTSLPRLTRIHDTIRYYNCKRRPLPQLTVYSNCSSMSLNDLFTIRKTKPRATLLVLCKKMIKYRMKII